MKRRTISDVSLKKIHNYDKALNIVYQILCKYVLI